MFGRFSKNKVYDMLHFTVVSGLMGITAFGTAWLGYKGVNWFIYRRPILQEQRRKKMEEKITIEQYEKEQELLRKQQEAEHLKV